MVPINGEQLEIWIASFLWPFIRILAMLATAPVFDNRTVQRRTRVGLAALIAILMMPLLPAPPVLSSAQAIPVLIQQILVGVAMGFSMRLVFAAFEMAGDLLGLQMGLAFAQFIDPARGMQTPLIGSFLGVLAMLTFLVIDGHLLVIAAVVQSFELIPISANLSVVNSQSIALAGSIMFMLALQISLPVMAAVLISNIVLGILARAAPQLNVMSIGFSITIGVGLWILWVSLPYFIAGIDGAIGRLLSISVLNTG
ncbi:MULTISPECIES: flagellar biosynthetic protein FliR [unclassified Limnobacter]|jgi:flagellar biosynthetic protein FliR|uniref:flagellar biosynthetic protein FliR n=1 Tax=unclassified Limnobacter TaxID=2630203 RepID=UPI000C6281AC|nr:MULTISPECIES: flagellar biosynthetic protein FliR [unclassified Limnobacter]MAG82237.1 flagellar biosynthetic protein FliR [Sutterellaceae bacterium]MBT85873.1 flagellar biosynthetic protein FliR [Sutterellaceae bacterium]HAV74523.1 flagellar biosynthetic protein FliR [Limnobacter sp.]|tara:strand:+ start:8012 stop:8776 length:765 start_codon:yes stop_codon:yes gene_type:complete